MDARILVVDDNTDIVESLKAALKSCEPSLDVMGLSDSANAIESIRGFKPDLVVLDIMMPGLTGWDIASTMKDDLDLRDIPIVYLTAKTDDLSRQMSELSCEEYVTKPFETEDLIGKIRGILLKEEYLKTQKDMFK
jgi:CheY-like chemotaxis protein